MKATILVAVYNYGKFLTRALDSALSQSLSQANYEVIVVDDGSEDNTPQILSRFDSRVAIIRQSHSGLAAACNRGIREARGEYLMRLDADDELAENALELAISAVDANPDAVMVCPDRWEIQAGGTRTRVSVHLGNIYEIIAPGILFRTRVLREAGGYRSLYWEEHDLMIRLRRQHEAIHLAEPTYFYHLHGNNMTSSESRRKAGWSELIGVWGIDELRRWGHCPEMESVEA